MSNVKFFQQAFVGGEVAQSMRGRVEDVGYTNGLARCRNFLVRPQGMVENRAGLRFVAEVKDSAKRVRLIPFSFSGEQTMVIELGDKYARFHTGAATIYEGNAPYEIATPYAEEHLMDIHHVQSADVLTLVHPNYPPQELRRLGATNWKLEPISFVPKFEPPTGLKAEATRVPLAPGVQQIDLKYRYKVTAVKDGVESKESAEVEVTNDLYTPGNTNKLTWQAVDGAEHYLVYKRQSGMFGLAGYANETGFEDRGVSPDMAKTPPKYKAVFDKADHYPAAVSYYQQRRCFAGTPSEPQKVWMTRSGTESDMSYSTPSRDDDRIEVRVAAREASPIRHIVPLTKLLILTGSAEWNVDTQNSDVLTNTTISISPHSYVGANNVQPVIVNASVIYCAARGGHVHELAWSRDAGGFTTADISLRAPHLFDGYRLVDMAYGKAPWPQVWFVSSDGRLIGNTYVPEQQIGAWHWHQTDGHFESCAVVAEGNEDMLYVAVRRDINGQTRRYIERLESRAFATPEEAFFVDSGLTLAIDAGKDPVTKIGGLSHLEGKTVAILADGAVHVPQTVTGGEIRLQHAARKIHVGLPYTAEIQTLPVVGDIDNGKGRGRSKNVNTVWLDVIQSSGIWAGPDESRLVEHKQRTTEPPGSPPRLKTGQIEITVRPDWNDYGQILVQQRDPLPLSLVSLTTEVAL
nr:MAG TPA: stabilization protein [Caudoviricetes sp.]